MKKRKIVLTATILSFLALGIVQAKDIYVSPSGSNSNGGTSWSDAYATITYALSKASTGDRILCDSGTWTENIEIWASSAPFSSITIEGKGPGISIIKAPPGSKLSKNFTFGSQSRNLRAIFFIYGNVKVTIRGFTLDGDHQVSQPSGLPPGTTWRGLRAVTGVNNVKATIENCHITNCGASPISGFQGNLGVYFLDHTSVVVRDCLVDKFDKGGIVANAGSEADVIGCTVVGAGKTNVTAQNGIQFGWDARGRMINNVVRDIWYTGSYWTACGLLLYDHGPGTTVAGNVVMNCQTGITTQGNDDSDTFTFAGNVIQGSDWGVVVAKTQGTIYGNYFIGNNHNAWDDGDNYPNSTKFAKWYYGDSSTGWGNYWDDFSKNSGYPNYYNVPNGGKNYVLKDEHPHAGDKCNLYSSGTKINLSAGLNGLLLADITGDGKDDLVTCNASAGTVTVSPGNGTGGFTPPGSPTITLPSGSNVSAIAAGEFNGSSGVDIAVACQATGKILIYYNNGTGGFSSSADVTVDLDGSADDAQPVYLVPARIDSDSKDDLVVCKEGTYLTATAGVDILLSGATPAFKATSLSPPSGYSWASVHGAALADFDGDSIADLAVTDGARSGVSNHKVVLFKGSNSSPYFTAQSTTIGAGTDPREIVAKDLDGDGKADLAWTAFVGPFSTGQVKVYYGNGSLGFTAGDSVDLGSGPLALCVSDQTKRLAPGAVSFRKDLVALNFGSGNVSHLARSGNYWMVIGALKPGNGPKDIVCKDVNGDSVTDLLCVNGIDGTVTVHLGVIGPLVQNFGKGCQGRSGVPVASIYGSPAYPYVPNPSFGALVCNARSGSYGVLMISTAAASPLPGTPCNFLLNSIDVAILCYVIDSNGRGKVPLPIPNNSGLIGAEAYMQWVILDPDGYFLWGLSLSNGLRLVLNTP